MPAAIRSLSLIAFTVFSWASLAHAAWSTDPTVDNIVVDATRDQRTSHAIPDGQGGVYVAWEDTRTGTNNFRVYVQRVSVDGDALWPDGGVLAGDGGSNQFDPRLALDAVGGVIVVWEDQRNYRAIYGQRFDPSGGPLWGASGLEICDEALAQYRPRIATDVAGGAFVAWNDTRRYNQEDIYGQRLDLDGNRLWTQEGHSIFVTWGAERNVRLAPDGSGGVIYVVNDLATDEILARRLNAAGGDEWGGIFAISTIPTNYPNLQICADGTGGVIATWSSTWYDLKAQRLDATGARMWNGGEDLEISALSTSKHSQVVAADGTGGSYVGFADTRDGSGAAYLQHISPGGVQTWGDAAVRVGDRMNSIGPGLRVDSSGAAIVSWPEPTSANFMMQKYDVAGIEQWTPGGVLVSDTGTTTYGAPQACETVDGGTIIIMERAISATNVDIHAKKVLADGTLGELVAVGDQMAAPFPLGVHPNPFRTHVQIQAPEGADNVSIFDAGGRLVRRFDRATPAMGSISWDGRDQRGRPTLPGVYFVRSLTDRGEQVSRLVRLR